MTYKTILCAGAVTGMLAAGALAQVTQPGQQQRITDQRELLQKLEGSWNVEVRAWDMEATPGMRQGVTPGVSPGVDAGFQQRIQTQIQQSLTQAGVSTTDAQRHSVQISQRITTQRLTQTQIEQELRQVMTQAGVDAQRATEESRRLSQQFYRELQQQPGQPGTQPGMHPGATPGQPGTQPGHQPGQPGVPGVGQIQQELQQGFQRAGMSSDDARRHAQTLATRFHQQQPDQTTVQRDIEQAMTQAGVERTTAEREARTLSMNVHRLVQQRPSVPGQQRPGTPGQPDDASVQRIQTQIEQGLTRAGVQQTQARTHAQTLASRFIRERMDRTMIERELSQVMTQAGVERTRAESEARTLATTIHTQVQTLPAQPGMQPERDDTVYPTPDRQFTAEPWRQQPTREATISARGTSERHWILDDRILQEEVEINEIQDSNQISPGLRQFGREGEFDSPAQRLREQENLEGHGMFSFDRNTNTFSHVWADNAAGKMNYSIGYHNAAENMIVFYTVDSRELSQMLPRQAGTQPGQQQPGQWDRPATQSGGTQFGATGRAFGDMANLVVLRIVSDNEHVVEYYKGNPSHAQRVLEVRYTRNN